MLCRLTPPLCLNFLGLMHLDSHIIADTGIVETSYTQVCQKDLQLLLLLLPFGAVWPVMTSRTLKSTKLSTGDTCWF